MLLHEALQEFGIQRAPSTKKDLDLLYRRLIKANHPDRAGGSNEKAQRINVARGVIERNIPTSATQHTKGRMYTTPPSQHYQQPPKSYKHNYMGKCSICADKGFIWLFNRETLSTEKRVCRWCKK